MNRPEREVLDKLGVAGLTRALHDLLDAARLVKIANACGVTYPGMRTQSQKKEKLVADVAARAVRDDSAGKAVVRALRKETTAAAREWGQLPDEERARRLGDDTLLRVGGNLGLHLFLAASAAPDEATESLIPPLVDRSREHDASPSAPAEASRAEDPAKEAARLRRKIEELKKKARHLEGQLVKSRETERGLKRDLMQRKGELAEARMLGERLRREVDEAKGAVLEASQATPTQRAVGPAIEEIDRGVKKLAAEQRKLVHRVEKMADAPVPTPTLPPEVLAPLSEAIEGVHREMATLRRERRKDLQDQAKRLDELKAALDAVRASAEAHPRSSRPTVRRKGEPERVGVFIDVQNMYYAARQLKGKLDFDALMAAAVLDRRLIHASAYVVESKEIDQSGFIAMLQQRAIEVRRKTLRVRADGSMKGDWDMEMALDILDMTPKLDVVVLVSGDGDFTSLVKRVKGMGPRVEVLAFPRNTAKSLLEAADRFQPLDRKYMIRTEASPRPDEAPADEPPAGADVAGAVPRLVTG